MDKYLIICIEFKCNNHCISCMIKDIKNQLVPVSFDEYKGLLDQNLKSKKYNCLVLSGAEVTMNENLLEFVRYAKSLGNIEHIRIQTNGRRLSDIKYCKSLINSGVDEFFISVYGPNKDVHSSLTHVSNSFDETFAGIKNINKLSKTIITNTVITKLNYKFLPDLVKKLSSFDNVKEMQFWNYCPMRENDEEDLLVSNQKVKQYLQEAIKTGNEEKIPIIVKYFPECLLENHRYALDNSQPDTIIDELHWQPFDRLNQFQCIYKEECSSDQCWGVPLAYVKKFGWNKDNFKPIRKEK